MTEKKERRTFTKEFKEGAVRLVVEGGEKQLRRGFPPESGG